MRPIARCAEIWYLGGVQCEVDEGLDRGGASDDRLVSCVLPGGIDIDGGGQGTLQHI